MRRRALIIGIGSFLVIGVFVTLAYVLFPFYKADIYRESLEAGFSAALGRIVKLEGPISLTFSLQPILILENFHVANPPWASQAHFFRADRLEIQVSLARLLQRRGLEVQKILLNGAELFLEETSDNKDNWTSQKEESASIWSQAVPKVSIDLTKTGTFGIKDSRISYQSYLSEVSHEMAIQQASASTIDERLREFVIEGHWDKVPFGLKLQGGRLMDLVDLQEAWPIDGTLSMNGVLAEVKGTLGGENSEETYSLHVQVNGDRLSALNEILKIDLPDSAPFIVIADVLQRTHAIDLKNIQAKLGSSEIAGHLNVRNQDTRQKIVGTLTADIIQVNDFLLSPKGPTREDSAQHSSSPVPEFLLPFDGDIDVTIHKWQLGETELGSSSFTTHLREKQIQVTPFQGQSFGGTLKANLDIDLKNSPPRARFTGNVQSINFGQALQSFGVTESLTGSTDLDVMVVGNGNNMQDFLKTLTVKLRTHHMTWGLADSIDKNPPPVALHQISLGVSKGGPIEIAAKGSFQKNVFKAKFMTVSLVELIKPGKPWPITLAAKMGGGVLAVKGTLNADLPEMGGMFAVSLKGKQFNELDASLPPVGPYHFMAQVTKEGSRYRVNRFQSRFGTSDLSGSLEVDTEKDTPALTGFLTAKHVNFTELSRPGDIAIPTDVISAADADVKLAIQQARIGEFELAGLLINATLQAGHLTIKDVQGTLLDQKSSYGRFQGVLELDTTHTIPSVSGRVALKDIRYEHVFPGVRFANLNEHVMNLDARFSSTGGTIFTMLNRSTVMVEGKKLQVQFYRETEHPAPVQLSSMILIESVEGGPLRLHAEGEFEDTPFRFRSSAGPVRDILKETGLWPVNVRVDVPHAMIELNGHVHLPHPTDELTFQVLMKGENLRDLDFLTTSNLPDAGPLELAGLVTKSPVGFHVTNFEGSLAGSDVKGYVTFMPKGIRTRVRGTLTTENLVLGVVQDPSADSSVQNKRSTVRAITDTVTGVGSKAIDALTGSIGDSKSSKVSEKRVFPDFVFPVESLRSLDLSFESEINHLIKGDHDLGHVKFRLTLDDGLLTLQPVTGSLWSGEIDGALILDVKPYVPTLEVNLNIRGLDYGRLTTSLGGSQWIQGQSQSIMLTLKGRGDTLNQVLGRAKGQLELVDGPLELSTQYLDLWAADFITTALSTAWKAEPETKLNCAVGYFDIDEGEMKTDNILIDTQRVTIAGAGTLNLASENLDLILTPKPKDPSLVSLAHTVRFSGPLSDPDVSRDKLRIAESGGWGLLGLANPIGWAIAIPQIAGTTVGTMNQNPCVEAMKSRAHTALTIEDLKGGLWGKFKRALSNLGGSSETPSDQPQ